MFSLMRQETRLGRQYAGNNRSACCWQSSGKVRTKGCKAASKAAQAATASKNAGTQTQAISRESSLIQCHWAIPPLFQSAVDSILIGVHQCAGFYCGSDKWFDGGLLNISQHMDHNLTTTLNHTKDGRLLFFQSPSATGSSQPVPSSFTVFFFTASG